MQHATVKHKLIVLPSAYCLLKADDNNPTSAAGALVGKPKAGKHKVGRKAQGRKATIFRRPWSESTESTRSEPTMATRQYNRQHIRQYNRSSIGSSIGNTIGNTIVFILAS